MSGHFKETGFHAYWFEQIMKDHIFNPRSKSNTDLSKKLFHREKYKKMWNGFYGNQPGSIHYLNFEKNITPSRVEYIRCFCYYFVINPNKWNVHYIHDDNFRIQRIMEQKYQDIESTFKNDFNILLKKSKSQNKSIKEMLFCDKGFSEIFKLYFRGEITAFSIIILEKLFGIFNNLNVGSFGIVDESKLNNLRIIFGDVYEFLYRDEFDWKDIFKRHMNTL